MKDENIDSISDCLDAGSLGRHLVATLPKLFARAVSLHDRSGHCHWRSGDDSSTSEYLGVRAALEAFVGAVAPSRVDVHLADGMSAVLLISRTNDGVFTGFVMLLVATARLRGKGRAAPDLPIPVIRAAHHWGELAPMHAEGVSSAGLQVDIEIPVAAAPPEPQTVSREKRSRKQRRTDMQNRAQVLEAVRTFPLALHAQRLTPLNAEVRIRRYEVLLRGSLSNSPATAPTQLLASAEATGTASVLDRRIISALIEWLGQHMNVWSDQPSQFSINLSASSLADPQFMDFVHDGLSKAELPQGLIAFEVDQGTAVADWQRLASLAAACEQIKAGLVIDNFTLHDNGVDLLALPALRLLKTARQLTTGLAGSRSKQAVIAGIAQMTRLSGIHSVAKQVDSDTDNILLASLGVDFVQSFAGSQPMALDELQSELKRRVIVDTSAMIDPALPHHLRIKPATR